MVLAPYSYLLNYFLSWLSEGLITTQLSKKHNENIWPDDYRSPPSLKNINWSLSDSQLADEISAKFEDVRKGPGSPNNRLKKWFRYKRPK